MMLQEFFPEHYHAQSIYKIEELKDAWCIEVDMPGVEKDKVDVNVTGRYLEVKGERIKGEKKTLYKERFRLPDSIRTPDGVAATLELGVLTVKVPKTGADIVQIPIS